MRDVIMKQTGPKDNLEAGAGVKKRGYGLLLVAILVFLVFAQVISFHFLKYDDTINVSENALLLEPSFDHFLTFWKAPFLGLYIPVTYSVWNGLGVVSLAVFRRLDPGLFHLLNLIIHIGNALLVFMIIGKLFEAKGWPVTGRRIICAATAGALVFGLHPVQVETVSWVTGLKGVLSGFFALGAVYLYLACFTAEKKSYLYGASTGLLILAILSMPSAIAVPVMVFFVVLWAAPRFSRRVIASLMLWAVIALAAVMITREAQPTPTGAYPWTIRPLVALDAVTFYLHKIVWPHILAIDYCRTPAYVAGLSWRNSYLLWILPVMSLVYAFRRRPRWLALGGAFLAGILPVSGLLPFAYQETSTVADRYLYLPMAVVAVAVAAVMMRKPRLWIIGLAFLLAAAWGVRSFYQCRFWASTESIMGHTLEYYPRSFRANLNYGIALMSRGDFTGAVPYYEAARRLKPYDPLPYFNLGLAYAAVGDDGGCERQYRILRVMDKAKAARLNEAADQFKALHRPTAGQ